MSNIHRHQEVLTKVNAWVDQGVLPLVNALNELHNVETLDSCEGNGDEYAYVFFKFREGSSDHAVLLTSHLAAELHRLIGEDCDYQLRVEWYQSDEPLMELRASPTSVGPVAESIRSIATIFRSYESLCGKSRTGPRSSRARPIHRPTAPSDDDIRHCAWLPAPDAKA